VDCKELSVSLGMTFALLLCPSSPRRCISPVLFPRLSGAEGGRWLLAGQEEEVPRLAAALSDLIIFTRLTDDFLSEVRTPASASAASPASRM